MQMFGRLAFLLLLTAPSQPVLADMAAIHRAALPQDPAVLQAYDDAAQLEPYTRSWSNKWAYEIPEKRVAARLGKDLALLSAAVQANPTNTELLLFAGLVAHYAYNVDVDGSFEKAVDLLGQAEKQSASDIRPRWFRAGLFCQTKETKAGMQALLAIENSQPWERLPAAFWDDYMECTSVNNMPAHLLRAADHLEKLQAQPSPRRSFLAETARKRYEPFDPKKDYKPTEVWYAKEDSSDVVFTSTACGVQLRTHAPWQVNRLDLTKGSCVAYFTTSRYDAVGGPLHPSVMVMVQRPQKGETLEQYSKKFLQKGTYEPFTPSHCPADSCIAMKGIQPGMYKENGGGHPRVLLFERESPEYPGLLLETPDGFPQLDPSAQTQYFRPNQVQARMPGKLFYLVLLDTAASIEEPALKDYEFFLNHLVAE